MSTLNVNTITNTSGNLGVNTASPTANLHLKDESGNAEIKLQGGASSANDIIAFLNSSGSTRGNITYDTDHDFLLFNINGSERMRIDSSGNLLVGTSTVGVAGSSSAGAGGLTFKPDFDDNALQLVFNRASTSNSSFVQAFLNAGTLVGAITYNNSSTTFTTSSDYRLKENAVLISDGITRLKTLKPYRFNFTVEPDKKVDGFFAHEVTAVPEAITGTKDEVDSDNNPVYQGIDQSKLVPLLTAALQEAVGKIEVLETKVAALEAK